MHEPCQGCNRVLVWHRGSIASGKCGICGKTLVPAPGSGLPAQAMAACGHLSDPLHITGVQKSSEIKLGTKLQFQDYVFILQVSCAELSPGPVAPRLLPGSAVKGNFMWYQTSAGPGREHCLGAAQAAEPGPARDTGQCWIAKSGLHKGAATSSSFHTCSGTKSAGFLRAAMKAL